MYEELHKQMQTVLLYSAAFLSFQSAMLRADTVTASLFTPLAPAGSTPVILGLPGVVTPSSSPLAGSGYSISFSNIGANEGVVQGSATGAYAVPVAGVSGSSPEYLTGGFGSALTTNMADSGSYLSTGAGTITITFSTPQSSFALLWGSIDLGNSLIFNDAENFTVTGSEALLAATGSIGNGYQGPGGSAYIVVDTTTPFTTATLTSSVISFESAAIAADTAPLISAVPEPNSLTLVGSGVGFAACWLVFRQRRVGSRAQTA